MAKHRHFRIEQAPSTARHQYIGVVVGRDLNIPARDDRASHADHLRQGLSRATEEAAQLGLPADREGITFVFTSEPGCDLVFDQLDIQRSDIELSNVRSGPGGTEATVYVPPGKVQVFFRLLDRCSDESEDRDHSPQGQKLFDSIASIRRATVEAFWTDARPFPEDPTRVVWWEVWVRSGRTEEEHQAAFERFAASLGDTALQPGMGFIKFPERLVLLVRGSIHNWAHHPEVLNLIAELREAKEVPTDLVNLSPADQARWVENAAARIVAAPATAPAVCVLDTGIWRDHPLLTSSLSENDAHAVDAAWGVSDDNGHGTQMAGLALFGQELQPFIEGGGTHTLATCLESSKILPPLGENDPVNYGYVTQEGVARAEVAQPHRRRTICLATTTDDRDQGFPSSWSAAIDAHASGALDGNRRLYVISAGNYLDITNAGYEYPAHNHTHAGIQDPAQSWNAITVGACTDRVLITDPDFSGWSPVAAAGGLTPTSRTSMMWTNSSWPIKPDLVMEGGNWAQNEAGSISNCDDLDLLTTTYSRESRLLDTMRDTSAATAQAARMCAQIQSLYPELWPETIRALLIHSARWTPQMREEFPGNDQESLRRLLRCYGYGVPNLDHAFWSLENQVSLVVEGELQPFVEEDGGVKNNEMHLHTLPWPVEELQRLGPADVTVRVTLSYFIEPSPGRRGWTSKFGYQSHGLRFKLRRPLDNDNTFRQRCSKAFWADPEVRPGGLSTPQNWALGASGLTNHGSIHSNWWKMPGADLAACHEVAVYPIGGWWKTRKHLGMGNRRTRYALVITIETDEEAAQLYTAISNKIAVQPQIAT